MKKHGKSKGTKPKKLTKKPYVGKIKGEGDYLVINGVIYQKKGTGVIVSGKKPKPKKKKEDWTL